VRKVFNPEDMSLDFWVKSWWFKGEGPAGWPGFLLI
jgi:hypothetical protein